MNKTLHILVTGRVQGVGFRHFTADRAKRLGLVGWVRNLRDGRVEALASGPKDKVLALIADINEGPVTSDVEEVQAEEIIAGESESNFSVVDDGDNPWQEG